MIIKYVTDGGAGAHTGDDLANAYDLSEMIVFLNADANTDHITFYLCGDFNVAAQINPNTTRNATSRCIFQGRTADGEADADIVMDAGGAAFDIWRIDNGGAGGTATHMAWRNVRVTNNTGSNHGFDVTGAVFGPSFFMCEADNVGGSGFHSTFGSVNRHHLMWDCYSHDNAVAGFTFGNGYGNYVDCVAKDNGGNGFDGGQTIHRCLSIRDSNNGITLNQCSLGSHLTAYAPDVGDGILVGGDKPLAAVRALSEAAALLGLSFPASSNYYVEVFSFGGFGNLSGTIGTPDVEAAAFIEGTISATASVFNDIGTEDFGLNEDLNGGVLMKNINGSPFPRGTTISYHAVGAVESPQAAGPGGGVPFPGTYVNKGVH